MLVVPPDLVDTLRNIVGRRHVLMGSGATRHFRLGYRTGGADTAVVVRPASLVDLWRTARACVAADVSVIMQAANTGLTGGSTPDGTPYPSGVVIISTTRITALHVLDGGAQVVCLPGTTLYALERALRPLEREPHSVIGSSCIGATVVGGVCNNSGGSLIQRGPAYTQLTLHGAVNAAGELVLVNHLGIALGNEPEEILARVEAGRFGRDDVAHDSARWASDRAYTDHVREIDAASPARFNADPRCLHEAAGSAGKLIVFAVRLDTFARAAETKTFYIGTNDPDELTAVRRALLAQPKLPIAGEYMHRTAFDIADVYGKDVFLAVRALGTDRLPLMFAAKARTDALADRFRLGSGLSDRVMQIASRLFGDHLPKRMRMFRDRFEHHLMLKVASDDAESVRTVLADVLPSDAYFTCTPDEADRAFLHRFAAAGAAVRYRAIHSGTVADIVALDLALPRNTRDWFERLPADIDAQVIHKLYYGHFFCHVFHQDYIVAKGVDPLAFEHRMWALLDARGAEYPAEHNVGHLYPAKPALAEFYRSIDPRNQLNPGIGQTTKARDWATETAG